METKAVGLRLLQEGVPPSAISFCGQELAAQLFSKEWKERLDGIEAMTQRIVDEFHQKKEDGGV